MLALRLTLRSACKIWPPTHIPPPPVPSPTTSSTLLSLSGAQVRQKLLTGQRQCGMGRMPHAHSAMCMQNVTINSSQVLDVFLAGLQDALTPCAKNVTSTGSATAGSTEYFSSIASVTPPPPFRRACILSHYSADMAQSTGAHPLLPQPLRAPPPLFLWWPRST